MQHIITVEGRSLIRTYLASATKNAAISSRAMSKLRGKKRWIDFALSKEMFTFAPDDELLKRLVAQRRVFFDAVYSRMWNWVRLPIRNPIFHQSPRLPLYKEILRNLPKLRKNEGKAKYLETFLSFLAHEGA